MTSPWSNNFKVILNKKVLTKQTDCEEHQRYVVPVEGEPPGHPAQQQDPEEEEGGHVEEGVDPIDDALLRSPVDDEQLKFELWDQITRIYKVMELHVL